MSIDFAVKVIAAIAGLVCGLTQTYMNGKALYTMATTNETEESTESNSSQEEGI